MNSKDSSLSTARSETSEPSLSRALATELNRLTATVQQLQQERDDLRTQNWGLMADTAHLKIAMDAERKATERAEAAEAEVSRLRAQVEQMREQLKRALKFGRHLPDCKGTGCKTPGCGHTASAHHIIADGACLYCNCEKYEPYTLCQCGFTALLGEATLASFPSSEPKEQT